MWVAVAVFVRSMMIMKMVIMIIMMIITLFFIP